MIYVVNPILKELFMKQNVYCALGSALFMALAFMFSGCEDHTIGEAIFSDDGGSDEGNSQQAGNVAPATTAKSSSYSSSNISGTWKGRAGTGQSGTTLRLSQNGNSLSGSWTWGAGDTRSCSGSKSGNSVVLKDKRSDGDTWHLTVSSDGSRLSGSGSKYGGGSYNVSFSR